MQKTKQNIAESFINTITLENGTLVDIETGEITAKPLIDKSKLGKERPWNGKKRLSKDASTIMFSAGLESKAERMRDCAHQLVFHKNDDGTLRLSQTWFCKVRLCPVCNWRRSLKQSAQLSKVVIEANSRHKPRWLFLTLTVKNCTGEELESTITNMTKAYNSMMKRKRVKDQVVGTFRALEITKNQKENTYHPHIHVLIAVKPSYFKSKENYIAQKEWRSLWQEAANLDYAPTVHIEAVKDKRTDQSLMDVVTDVAEEAKKQADSMHKAILETAKYTVKDTEILNGSEEENVETARFLDEAMHGKRLVAYGGELKKIHKALNLADDDENLINVNEDSDAVASEIQKVTARWNSGFNMYTIVPENSLEMH